MYGPVTCHKSVWSDHQHQHQHQPQPQLPPQLQQQRASNPPTAMSGRRLMHQRTAGPILLDSPFPSSRQQYRGSYPSQFHRSQSDLPGGGGKIRLERSTGGPQTLKQYIPVLWGWLSPDRAAAKKLREIASTWSQAVGDTSVYEALLQAESTTLQPLKGLRAVKNFEIAASREAAGGVGGGPIMVDPTATSTSTSFVSACSAPLHYNHHYPLLPPQPQFQHQKQAPQVTAPPPHGRARALLLRPRLCRCRGKKSISNNDGGSASSSPRCDDEEVCCPSCGGEYLHTARTACTSRNVSVRRLLPSQPIATALYEFRDAKSTTIESAPQTRESIIYWMARVIETMGWPVSSFFTAVHAFDVAMASGIMPKPEYIPRISTSCVLIGVCSECDYKQMTKARWFVNQVPHVNNVRDLVISQMYIVSYLKGGSLMHKTPVDFIMIYLSAIDRFTPKFETMTGMRMSIWDVGIRLNTHNITSSMLEYIINPITEDTPHSGLIPLAESMVDLLLCVSVFCFVNMTYPVLEMSKLIATVILDILMATHPAFYKHEFAQVFVKTAFRLDLMDEVFPLWRDLTTLYQACKTDSLTVHPPAGQRRFPGWSPRTVALLDHLLSLPREFPFRSTHCGSPLS